MATDIVQPGQRIEAGCTVLPLAALRKEIRPGGRHVGIPADNRHFPSIRAPFRSVQQYQPMCVLRLSTMRLLHGSGRIDRPYKIDVSIGGF